jgi:pyruvate dehydrogenase E2 component (dihydrolipoamide acetyltransferase)
MQSWHRKKGDSVKEGDILFSYETDKASFEFAAPVSGTLLDIFANEGDDVPVHAIVAAIGNAGEDVSGLSNAAKSEVGSQKSVQEESSEPAPSTKSEAGKSDLRPLSSDLDAFRISPRAKNLAERSGVDPKIATPTGPHGRVIERDVKAIIDKGPLLTKTAQEKAVVTGLTAPAAGSGIGGRIRAEDLLKSSVPQIIPSTILSNEITEVKLSGMRKIIGERMMQSLREAAQLTMNASARADGLLAYRAMVKKSGEKLGLANITITDLVCYAVAKTLPKFPDINALFSDGKVIQHKYAHLAVAVDTPRGLMVPVVKYADLLSLNDLAKAIKSLTQQCLDGAINPDFLTGGTLTISNLGSFGIESFTPVLNPPQVALLGVNTITPKPVGKEDGGYAIVPHIGLSLTIDHRAVDGAPGARFLKSVVDAIENIGLLTAM